MSGPIVRVAALRVEPGRDAPKGLSKFLTAAERRQVAEDDATFVYLERIQAGATFTFRLLATDLDVPTTVHPEVYGDRLASQCGAPGLAVEPGIVWRRGTRGWETGREGSDDKVAAGCRYPVPGEAGDFHLDLRTRAGVAA